MNKKIIAFWGAVLVLYLVLGFFLYSSYGFPNGTNDFVFHYFKAGNSFDPILEPYYSLEIFNTYPDFYHNLFSIFSFNPFVFWLSNVLLVLILIPFLLYKLANSELVIPIYFCLVSVAHSIIYSAVFPSMIVFVLMLIYFNVRKKYFWAWLPLFMFASLVHRSGFELFLLILILEIINSFIKDFELKAIAPFGFLQGQQFSLLEAYRILTLYLPIYVLIPALKIIVEKKEYFYLMFICVALYFTTMDLRVLNVVQLIAVIFSAQYFENFKYKKLFWFACFVMLLVNILLYFPKTIAFVTFI